LNPQLERQTNIFVVRIWREYLTAETPALRGEVEDLARHTRQPFTSMQELESLVWACCLGDGANGKVDLKQVQD
jgi:hypothetical protein